MQPTKIVKTLNPLSINERLVFRTLSMYKETNDASDWMKSGRPRVAQTKELVCAVCAHMMWNSLQKQKIMAREMQIAPRTISRILHHDLGGLQAYKRYTRHLLTAKLKEIRRARVEKLLESYGSGVYRDILFTHKKTFN